MTRINLVDPRYLTNAHLMAEYRELPRIFTSVRKLVSRGISLKEVHGIPDTYKLGTGHVKFFYPKLFWLRERYITLYEELIRRGFNLDKTIYVDVRYGIDDIPAEWFGNYLPKPEDLYLNMARLAKRSKLDNVLDELQSTL